MNIYEETVIFREAVFHLSVIFAWYDRPNTCATLVLPCPDKGAER